jgi:hypothetical protein
MTFNVYFSAPAAPSFLNVMFCEFAKPIVVKYYCYLNDKRVCEVMLIVQSTRFGL